MKSFQDLGLSEDVLKELTKKGFEVPTPIQEQTIPAILMGTKDIVGQAQTGTGKTAAFGLPIIEQIQANARKTQALILTPTRELAIQVAEEINSFKGKKKISIIPIYGGQSISLQLRSLQKGVDIVVGTPGRVLDHLKRKTLNLEHVAFFVLDEADEMLNMGFQEEVTEIFEQMNKDKRTLLFSATMPPEILKIAKKYMNDYDVIKVAKNDLDLTKTDQLYFEVSERDKFEALCRIIDIEEEFYGLVFCRTKLDVDKVSSRLVERGYDADALHGDMTQNLRENILQKLKKKLVNILVATDVAARGIDVQSLTHVINYAIPHDPESYVHRIGRTGRAGKSGTAITFVTSEEHRKLTYITHKVKANIKKASVPKVKDLIKRKKDRIKVDLNNIIKAEPSEDYLNMAQDLLGENDPQKVLAAILQNTYHTDLDASRYADIREVSVDKAGKTRLFVSQGQLNGLTAAKLISFVKKACNISDAEINDVQIRDKFSFVTLPFKQAEVVLASFQKRRKSGDLVFEKANAGRDVGPKTRRGFRGGANSRDRGASGSSSRDRDRSRRK